MTDGPLLTIETTCDETAAAIIAPDLSVLASVVASQEELHEMFGGVVPEIASRAHLERIVPVVSKVLREANVKPQALAAIAVANTPGLAGSLLVGLAAAKALAWSLAKPLITIDHLQAHIYAGRMSAGRDIFPCVGFVVSGGHTNLYRCGSPLDFTPLGATIDDAAGEAFDKTAALLGLPFPGGPNIQRVAETGDAKRFRFPRPLLQEPNLRLSFSGLKTSVRRTVEDLQAASVLSEQEIADVAASFQAAVVDCLVGKAARALDETGFGRLCLGGGVAANSALRNAMQRMIDARAGAELIVPPLQLCTDNAVMGAIAWEKLRAGEVADWHADVRPGLVRG